MTSNLFICPTCQDSFTYKKSYKKHLQKHRESTASDSWSANSIGLASTSEDYVKPVVPNYDGKYECGLCKLSFENQDLLRNHEMMSCVTCHKGFSRAKCLEKHMQACNSTAQYPCMHCSRKFAKKIHHKRHLQNDHAFIKSPKIKFNFPASRSKSLSPKSQIINHFVVNKEGIVESDTRGLQIQSMPNPAGAGIFSDSPQNNQEIKMSEPLEILGF